MNTGRLVTVQRDVNPRSSTYNTTREEYTYDDIACPAGLGDWEEYNQYCELNTSGGNTGYQITQYRDVDPASPTYMQTYETKLKNIMACPNGEQAYSVYIKPVDGIMVIVFDPNLTNDLWGWGIYTQEGTHYTAKTSITLNSATGDYMQGESFV